MLQKRHPEGRVVIQLINADTYFAGTTSQHEPVRKMLMRRFHHGIDESAFTIPDYSRGKVFACADISLNIVSSYQSSHQYFFSPYKALPVQQAILSSLPLRAPPVS